MTTRVSPDPTGPDSMGHFGDFGGRFMPEALMAALDELTVAWQDAMADPAFVAEFESMLREYAGTPSLLYDARRLSEGARVVLVGEALVRKSGVGAPRDAVAAMTGVEA